MPINKLTIDADSTCAVSVSMAREDTDAEVEFTFSQDGYGSIEVRANDQLVLTLSDDGYLRRASNVSSSAGVRRTPDGKMAMPGRSRG